jgi:hypothetical protein
MRKLIYLSLILTIFSSVSKAQSADYQRLKEKDKAALAYCKKNKMDTTFCLLVDMKIHPGKYRFFVWSFADKKVIKKSLCCHGMGKGSTEETPVFSNTVNSNCTSLGKYKTGIRSYSKYGIHVHYKLHGLEKTNSNALKRVVVLHSYNPVPSAEIYPKCLPMGWSLGCTVVSNEMMLFLDSKLQKSKPVLLWIFN